MDEQLQFPAGSRIWPSISNVGGDVSDDTQAKIRALVTELAEYSVDALERRDLSRFEFPLFRPFNAVFALAKQRLLCVDSTLTGGVAVLRFQDWRHDSDLTLDRAVNEVKRQLGWTDTFAFEIPIFLIDQSAREREGNLRELAKNLAEEIRVKLEKRQHPISFNPIFTTTLEDMDLDDTLCFVLMPFQPQFNRLYDNVIEPAVKDSNTGLQALRADEDFSPTPIMEKIWKNIATARVIIADVTGKNPNVFYELGLAHTIGKSVIIITQRKEDVPFDIAHIRYFPYDDDESGWRKLTKDLQSSIRTVLTSK